MVKQTYIESDWSKFHRALEGYDVYSRITGKRFTKVAIWNEYKDKKTELELIKTMFHCDFIFKENENHFSRKP